MRRILREALNTILIGLIMFATLQSSFQNYRVEGESMLPTLVQSQFLMVNKVAYARFDFSKLSDKIPFLSLKQKPNSHLFDPPKRGDIIVFSLPDERNKNLVKRVVAVPGDLVGISNGQLRINGLRAKETYLYEKPSLINLSDQIMLPGEYFVLGDNRMRSHDSKNWGSVNLEDIIGKVWVSYWPLSNLEAY
ncbi:MAG: signal peptidase I [Chloroflexi bacterium]|jgi:signal peptidase I|nr:MAG: signal peptidase I [Chloroflexota bacterium]